MTPTEAAAKYLTSIGQAGSAEQCRNGRFRLTVRAFEEYGQELSDTLRTMVEIYSDPEMGEVDRQYAMKDALRYLNGV